MHPIRGFARRAPNRGRGQSRGRFRFRLRPRGLQHFRWHTVCSVAKTLQPERGGEPAGDIFEMRIEAAVFMDHQHHRQRRAFGDRAKVPVHAFLRRTNVSRCRDQRRVDAGISRSQAAAAILMCQHAPGQEEAAFLRLMTLRKHGWPNTRMVEFADALLERDGALMRGLLAYRRALLQEKPHLKDVIRNIGRGHELPA